MNMNENGIINEELIAQNADFLKAVVQAKTFEEAQGICAEYKIELPAEVWKDVQAAYSEGELSEDDLGAVSGGKLNGNYLLQTIGGIAGLGGAIAMGAPAGVLLACAWIGYNAYRTFR